MPSKGGCRLLNLSSRTHPRIAEMTAGLTRWPALRQVRSSAGGTLRFACLLCLFDTIVRRNALREQQDLATAEVIARRVVGRGRP